MPIFTQNKCKLGFRMHIGRDGLNSTVSTRFAWLKRHTTGMLCFLSNKSKCFSWVKWSFIAWGDISYSDISRDSTAQAAFFKTKQCRIGLAAVIQCIMDIIINRNMTVQCLYIKSWLAPRSIADFSLFASKWVCVCVCVAIFSIHTLDMCK